MRASSEHRPRWSALTLLCAAYFMVILDVAIVGVAAPSIKEDLGFSQGDLQWVVSAYAITFGGLLLLGGRAADLLGRRRVFAAGTVLFAGASLVCGLAWSPAALLVARVAQGLGAAVLSPAALSIITTLFTEGAERNKALGAWNAVGAVGGTAGLVLGGVLTDVAGWEWMFFVNVPVGVLVLALTPVLVPESRASGVNRRFDLGGALAVTASLVLFVYALVEAPEAGWGSIQTVLLLLGSAALMAAFISTEARSRDPLLPLALFRLPALAGGNLLGVLAGAAIFSWFFIATLYLQQVLGYSPLRAGLAFLAGSLGGLAGSAIGQAVVTKVGLRPVGIAGAAMLAGGLLLQLGIDTEGDYGSDLMPAFVLMGVGTGLLFVTSAIAALGGVEERHAGLASGMINTSQQIGGALGVAIVSTVAVSRTEDVLGDANPAPSLLRSALTEGFQDAYLAAIAFPVLAVLTALVLLRRAGAPPAVEAAPAPASD